MNRLFWILFFSICANIGIAQDFETDYKTVITAFSNAENLHISSKVKVYSSIKKERLISTYNVWMKASKEGNITFLDNVKMINNKEYSLMVDYENKMIQVQKTEEVKKTKQKKMLLSEDLAKLIQKKQGYKISYLGNKDGLKTYKIDFSNSIYDYIVISLSTKNKALSKISIKYDETVQVSNNYLEIVYTKFSYSNTFSSNTFSGDEFVLVKDKKFVLTDKYKTYKLITQ